MEIAAISGASAPTASARRVEFPSHGAAPSLRKRLARAAKHLYLSLNPVMRRRRARWLKQEGVDFLRRLGIAPGDVVVDFGCGPGNYSIPAARVVGAGGLVVAVDVSERALAAIHRSARADIFRNVRPARHRGEVSRLLDGRPCRAVLIFDVLHFMDRDARQGIYRALHGMMARDGLLFVHPKHLSDDEPSRFFSDMTIAEVVREIEAVGFRLQGREATDLWHGHGRESSVLLSFRSGVETVAV